MDEENRIHPANSQERSLFHIWQKNKNDTGINLAFAFRAENLDAARFQAAINKIIARHEGLRSFFFEKDGIVFKKVLPHLQIEIKKLQSDDLRKFIRPFNLEEAPLFRIASRGNILCLDFCHAITDGLSMALFFSELNEFYSGKEVFYSPSPAKIEDTCEVQKNTLFWTNQFKNPFTPLSLPYDKKIPQEHGGEGSSIVQGLGKRLTKKVQQICRKLSVTPFVFYFSAFIRFLAQISASSDVITTTNFSCRNSHNLRQIGLLASSAPIRFNIDKKTSAIDLIKSMNDYIRSCLAHQNLDPEKLLEEFSFSDLRDFSRTIFTYEHEKIADIRLDGKKCSFIPIPSRHSAADFTLCLFPFNDEGKILFIFRADLFSHFRAREMIRNYISVIKKICDEIEIKTKNRKI